MRFARRALLSAAQGDAIVLRKAGDHSIGRLRLGRRQAAALPISAIALIMDYLACALGRLAACR